MNSLVKVESKQGLDESNLLVIESNDISIVPHQCPLSQSCDSSIKVEHDNDENFAAYILVWITGFIILLATIWYLARGYL